jgi:hypothetical protein
MTLTLALLVTAYGIFGLLFAVVALPIMRERNRIRRQQFDQELDAMMYDLVKKLEDLRNCGTGPLSRKP